MLHLNRFYTIHFLNKEKFMDASVASHGIWGLVIQSDFVSKTVLLLLFVMSVLSWAIALYKFILFRIKETQCKQVLDEIKACNNLLEVAHLGKKHAKTLPGYILIELLAHIKQAKDAGAVDMYQVYSDQILDEVMYQEESYTPVLSVSSAVATLLGLFGTIWGLIHAFIRISEKQSADIATVAPGIAEALITTVAGLMVAIPALAFLHFINVKTRDLEHQLAILCDKVTNIARLTSLKPAQKDVTNTTEDNTAQDQSSIS